MHRRARTVRTRIAELRLPAPERRAARAEREAEAAIAAERYPSVCYLELRRAAIEAEHRRWNWLGDWR